MALVEGRGPQAPKAVPPHGAEHRIGEPTGGKSVARLRCRLMGNRLRGLALRFYSVFCKWGARHSFEARFLALLLPVFFGLFFSFSLWVLLPDLPALYGTVLGATLLYLAVTASAFFCRSVPAWTERTLEAVWAERANILRELAVAKEQAAIRKTAIRTAEAEARKARREQERMDRQLQLARTRQAQAARNQSLHAGRCPNCGAELQVIQRGYDTGTGLTCCLFAGPLGLLAGLLDSGKRTRGCPGCGREFKFDSWGQNSVLAVLAVVAAVVFLLVLLGSC